MSVPEGVFASVALGPVRSTPSRCARRPRKRLRPPDFEHSPQERRLPLTGQTHSNLGAGRALSGHHG